MAAVTGAARRDRSWHAHVAAVDFAERVQAAGGVRQGLRAGCQAARERQGAWRSHRARRYVIDPCMDESVHVAT